MELSIFHSFLFERNGTFRSLKEWKDFRDFIVKFTSSCSVNGCYYSQAVAELQV